MCVTYSINYRTLSIGSELWNYFILFYPFLFFPRAQRVCLTAGVFGILWIFLRAFPSGEIRQYYTNVTEGCENVNLNREVYFVWGIELLRAGRDRFF